MTTQPKRKRGRPVGSPNRTSGALLKPLMIRLTATAHAALVKLAAKHKVSIAAACRMCIADTAELEYRDQLNAAFAQAYRESSL